jgi:hypothetical protein
LLTAVLQLLISGEASCGQSDGLAFFEKKIRPILSRHCYKCHSAKAKDPQGELLLDSSDSLREGGASGPVVVPGNPQQSLLIQALRHEGLEMPPEKKLSEAVVADFVHWINIGAPAPRDSPSAKTPAGSHAEAVDLWSLRPLAAARVPRVKDESWPRSDVDRFVMAGLQAKGLRPVDDAAPHVLLRRLHYVLTGLPPTPQQVEQFEQAAREDLTAAVENVVDQLLASPHFGERWGRHWLDVARYADVSGATAPAPFSEAWRYRQYVIHALNTDKPFDRFVREQLAGDLLPADEPQQRAAAVVATGYLALFHIVAADRDPEKRRLDVIDEQLDVLGKTFLGISLGCARCHDHKLDPVPMRDYYALVGVFGNAANLTGGFGTSAPQRVALGDVAADAPAWLRGEDAKVLGIEEQGSPRDEPIRFRGQVEPTGAIVPRGFPTMLEMIDAPVIPSYQSGRLQFAEWLLSEENPLVARVIVNRIWHHVFGQGLVRSTDNFGTTGDPPSHPELLDWLAHRFRRRHGWSMKSLIRELLLTRTWQLSADADAQAVAADPDNRLLGRANRRRQDAEALVDAVQFLSGRLDLEPAAFTAPKFSGGNQASTINLSIPEETLRKRAVYWPVFRKDVPVDMDVLTIFDRPSATVPCGRRAVSVVPAQGLYLLNSPLIEDCAESLSEKLQSNTALVSDSDRIRRLYLCLYARPPSHAERERALQFVTSVTRNLVGRKTSSDEAARLAWARLCHTLMISNELLVIQ